MTKDQFRARAYGCYVSGFKQEVSTSNAVDTPQAQRYRRYLRHRLESWLSQVPRNAAIADLGCGDGMLLRVFQEMGFTNLHGVEGSPEMVTKCRVYFPAVEQGDLREYLRSKVGTFDVVVLFDVIEHFTRAEAVDLLDEINAALKPGGLLVMQLPNGDSPFANAVFAADITHETLYTRGSLGHMLAIGGFELLAVDEHSPEPVDFSSGLRWLGWTLMRAGLVLCHRVETGGRSSGAYTRVIRAVARKR